MNHPPWDYVEGLPRQHHHMVRHHEPVVLDVRPARHRPRMMSGDYARAPMFYHMPGGLLIPEETHALTRSRSTGHRAPLEERHYSPPQQSPNLPVVINNYQRAEDYPMRGRPLSMAEDPYERDHSPYAHHHSPRPRYREHSRPGAHSRESSPFHDWRQELEMERLKKELEDVKREKEREAQEERMRKDFALEQARKEKERQDEESRLLLEQARRKKERQEEETRFLLEQAKKNKERQEEEERIVRERARKQKEREEEQERLKRELMSAHEREKREREAEEERIRREFMLKEEKKKRDRQAEEERIKNEILLKEEKQKRDRQAEKERIENEIMIEQAKKEKKKKEEEEQRKAFAEQAVLEWQRKEHEKAEKEKKAQEERDAEYKERLKRDLGLTDHQATSIIKKDNDNAVDLRRVTFTKISKRHVSIETLKAYNMPYKEDDRDEGFVLIKRWVPEYEQRLLWDHTRQVREQRELNRRRIEMSRVAEEQKVKLKYQKKKEVRAKSPGGFFGLVRR